MTGNSIPAEAIFQLKHFLRQAKNYWIEKCGHFPDDEQPEQLFSILKSVRR